MASKAAMALRTLSPSSPSITPGEAPARSSKICNRAMDGDGVSAATGCVNSVSCVASPLVKVLLVVSGSICADGGS